MRTAYAAQRGLDGGLRCRTIVPAGHPGLVGIVLVTSHVVKRHGQLVGVDLPAPMARLLESRNRIAAAAVSR